MGHAIGRIPLKTGAFPLKTTLPQFKLGWTGNLNKWPCIFKQEQLSLLWNYSAQTLALVPVPLAPTSILSYTMSARAPGAREYPQGF